MASLSTEQEDLVLNWKWLYQVLQMVVCFHILPPTGHKWKKKIYWMFFFFVCLFPESLAMNDFKQRAKFIQIKQLDWIKFWNIQSLALFL